LAESLEALLPTTDENVTPTTPNLGTFHREQLFLTHPHRQQVSEISFRIHYQEIHAWLIILNVPFTNR